MPENFKLEFMFDPFGFVIGLCSLCLSAAIALMSVKYMRGESISFNDLISLNFNQVINYILVILVSTIFMIIGFIFLTDIDDDGVINDTEDVSGLAASISLVDMLSKK